VHSSLRSKPPMISFMKGVNHARRMMDNILYQADKRKILHNYYVSSVSHFIGKVNN
jgi:hypothetical protein